MPKTADRSRSAATTQQDRPAWLPIAAVLGALVLILVAALWFTGGFGSSYDDLDTSGPSPSVATASAEASAESAGDAADAITTAEVTEAGGLRYGSAEAEHEVVIYDDLLCPYCRQLETTVGDDLAELVVGGTVAVEFRTLNFLIGSGDYSLRASNAVAVVMDTTGPAAAWRLHAQLFEDQPDENGDKPDDDWLIEQAVAAGAAEDAVRADIEGLTFQGWINRGTIAALDADIEQTPTVIVDGDQLEGDDINELSSNLLNRVS